MHADVAVTGVPLNADSRNSERVALVPCTAIIGRLGTAPLGGVGLSIIAFNFSNFMFNFLLYVTTPKIAAAVAKNDMERVRSGGVLASPKQHVHSTFSDERCPCCRSGA